MATAMRVPCIKHHARVTSPWRRAVAVVVVAVLLAGSASLEDAGALQACASANPVVTSAAALDEAISCYNNQTPAGDHIIAFGSNIVHPAGTPDITQNNATHDLTVLGFDHTLTGPGAGALPGAINLFTVTGRAPVTFKKLVLTGAVQAGIRNDQSDVTISNSTIRDDNFGLYVNGGSVTVSRSSIAHHASSGIFVGSGAYVHMSYSTIDDSNFNGVFAAGGTVAVVNSTLTNSGSYGVTATAGATVAVSNSTIANNATGVIVGSGSTVAVSNSTITTNTYGVSGSSGTVQLASSIVSDNWASDCDGPVTDAGSNFAEDASCGAGFATVAPPESLGALADNGGPTETHGLLAGSNAIDAGDCTNVIVGVASNGTFLSGAPTTDQRGVGFPRTLGGGCDAGAFEAAVDPLSRYVALNPARILDSRSGLQVGAFDTPWASGETRQVAVTDVGGVPAAGVYAVAINVTTVSPSAGFSWLTISPTGEPASSTAVHNFGTDSYTTELSNDVVIAKVGSGGTIDVRNETGTVDLVIDVVGYYALDGAGYVALNPARILDSRSGPLNQGPFDTPWSAAQTRTVAVTDIGGVPASGVEAVVLNVTTVSPSAGISWLTVTPTGQGSSSTAVHNFGTDPYTTELVNDVVIAKVGSGGNINIRNQAGTVDLVIDVVGYYSSSGGDGYTPLNPSRILDTRNSAQGDYDTPWGAGQTRDVETTFDTCATAVVLHVTSVDPTAALSWLTVSPAGVAGGTTAAHNFGTASYTSEIANDLVIAKTGTGGNINIRNETGTVDLVIDLVGYYGNCP